MSGVEREVEEGLQQVSKAVISCRLAANELSETERFEEIKALEAKLDEQYAYWRALDRIARMVSSGDYEAAIAYLESTESTMHAHEVAAWAKFIEGARREQQDLELQKRRDAHPEYAKGSQTFEVNTNGLIIAMESNSNGTALMFINKTQQTFSFAPSEIKLYTKSESVSPCIMHHMSLFGLGSPSIDASVRPAEQSGFVLTGCVPMGSPMVFIEPITKVEIKGQQVFPQTARPHNKS